ncbi:MAG: hypothetical protein J5736_06010, partial [Bacilli bacterium]|nr:hypothetical protein [Bacilli bacterium]
MKRRKQRVDPSVVSAYAQNELAANRQMTSVMVLMAILFGLMLIGYISGFFPFFRPLLVYISFPICI